MSTQLAPKNRILASLPTRDYERLSPQLKPVELHHSQILYRTGEVMDYVYFPNGSMVSLISETASGESVEVGVVGFEGVAGISCVLGVDKSPYEALVQYPNGALRMRVADLRTEFKLAGVLHSRLLRYVQGLLLQTSQVAACNRLHTVSERLARWLLMSQDRCLCEELPFTHEFLSLMLGTRRASVTDAVILKSSIDPAFWTTPAIAIQLSRLNSICSSHPQSSPYTPAHKALQEPRTVLLHAKTQYLCQRPYTQC
jgi:CRP-like cAMP-binding protein